MSGPGKFRTVPMEVEAMQMPAGHNYEAVREIAVWMTASGYEAVATPDEVDEEYLDDQGRVLPEFGVNYLSGEFEDGEERNAYLEDWVVRDPSGEFTMHRPEDFIRYYLPSDPG